MIEVCTLRSPSGQVTGVTYGDSTAETRSYDMAYRVGTVAADSTQSRARHDRLHPRPAGHRYLGGVPLADINPDSGAVFFLHTDHLGAPQIATTSAGAVAWQGTYTIFGSATARTGLLTQNLRLPGQYADTTTAYSQNGFRDYYPALGRYLESDPIWLNGRINTFAYVSDNPFNRIDPKGLQPRPDEAQFQLQQDQQAATDQAATNLGTLTIAQNPKLTAMSRAGSVIDQADAASMLTKAGRSLAKKAGRPGSSFIFPGGAPNAINDAGQSALENILNNPGSKSTPTPSGRFPGGTDSTAPNGQGARFRPSSSSTT